MNPLYNTSLRKISVWPPLGGRPINPFRKNVEAKHLIVNPTAEELRELARPMERTSSYGSATYVTKIRSRSAKMTYIHENGFTCGVKQVPIATEGRRYRVDLMIGRLVVEVDGMRKYLPAVRGADDPRTVEDVVRAEKAREAAIVRAGHPVLRLTWGDIVTAGGDIRYGTVGRMVSVLLERAPAA